MAHLPRRRRDRTRREAGAVSDVNDHDVLLGRGKRSYNHIGNVRFRELVSQQAVTYQATKSKPIRKAMAHEIMIEVESRGGRFLKPVDADRANDGAKAGRWVCVSQSTARTKVKQALRDMAMFLSSNQGANNEQRKDSTNEQALPKADEMSSSSNCAEEQGDSQTANFPDGPAVAAPEGMPLRNTEGQVGNRPTASVQRSELDGLNDSSAGHLREGSSLRIEMLRSAIEREAALSSLLNRQQVNLLQQPGLHSLASTAPTGNFLGSGLAATSFGSFGQHLPMANDILSPSLSRFDGLFGPSRLEMTAQLDLLRQRDLMARQSQYRLPNSNLMLSPIANSLLGHPYPSASIGLHDPLYSQLSLATQGSVAGNTLPANQPQGLSSLPVITHQPDRSGEQQQMEEEDRKKSPSEARLKSDEE